MEVTVEELRSRLEYNPETGLLYWRKGSPRAGKEAFTTINARGYKATTFRPKSGPATTLSAHRAAWAIHYGEFPSGSIDHINGDKTDDKIENLRDVTSAENARNASLSGRNKSGVPGVFIHKQTGKWCAQISAFGKHVGLGLFSSQSDAIIARKAAERVLGYHPNHGRPIK